MNNTHPLMYFITALVSPSALLSILLSSSAIAQDAPGELIPRPGPEITELTVNMQSEFYGPCLLLNTGKLFCWSIFMFPPVEERYYPIDFVSLNNALDNDIADFSLGRTYACAIGKQAGVACVDNPQYGWDATGIDQVPEPDAHYIAISKLDLSESICGIQADNRTVCWGASDAVKNVPDEARYLKQVDVEYSRACGVDLNDSLVCWGENIFADDQDYQFGNEDPVEAGSIKQIAFGPYGACVLKTDSSVRCFAGVSQFTEALDGREFKSIDLLNTSLPSLCFEDMDGKKDCLIYQDFSEGTSISSTSEMTAEPRLIWAAEGRIYQINKDNNFINYGVGYGLHVIQNLFPAEPTNLHQEIYSQTALELFWDRTAATGFEIYLDGQLIDLTGHVSSYFTNRLDDASTARFGVRAIDGAVGSYLVNVGGYETPPVAAPTNLRGDIYSSTALEIFYDRDISPFASYEIFRNGELLIESHTGTSLFESGLEPDTEYTYSVKTVVDGVKSNAATITLTTRAS